MLMGPSASATTWVVVAPRVVVAHGRCDPAFLGSHRASRRAIRVHFVRNVALERCYSGGVLARWGPLAAAEFTTPAPALSERR